VGCVPGVEQNASGFALRSAGDGIAGGRSRLRPWLEVKGDFGVTATVASDTDKAADLTLYGALPQGEWWQGTKRLDVGLRPGKLVIAAYLGDKPAPSVYREFPTPALPQPTPIGVRRIGAELVFRAGGADVARIADPGLFAGGVVHFGLNVGPRTTLTISDVAVEVPPSGAGSIDVVPGFLGTPPSSTSLRSLAATRGFRIGSLPDPIATDPDLYGFMVDPLARQTLAREFNQVVVPIFLTNNAVARDRNDFCVPDAVVAFGRAHGMEMRGDTLVYTTPKWLTADTFGRDQLAEWLHGYILAVVGRYKGQIASWEVANEIFKFRADDCVPNDKDGNSAFWVRSLGMGYVDQAFRWAHEADPQAHLYYNENRAEGLGTKSDCVYKLVKDLRDRGVPVDGVGLQSHFIVPEAKTDRWLLPPPMADVAVNMKRFADLGVRVQITEIDVQVGKDPAPALFDAQAKVYADMLRTCLAATNCPVFTTWGVSDRYSWIRSPSQNKPWEQPCLFDAGFKPKFAYSAVAEALQK
jgi:endo-1,4-beta-xylanase